MVRSPVLIIAFNRPAPTALVMAAVRAARPPRLYVAVDGPRPGREDDQANCAAVREIASAVDWPCEFLPLFRDANLGCRLGVSSAIDWFFGHEPEGIILEDDCVPDQSFFRYCDELLERYRDDDGVAQVCGSSFLKPQVPDSYFATKYADIWGWATWRRAWQHADMEMRDWPEWRDAGGLARLSGSTPAFVNVWTHVFDECYAGRVDTWDYQWMYTCWRQGWTSLMPARSMISNVGYGPDATHTMTERLPAFVRPSAPMPFPLAHPQSLAIDAARERALARVRYALGPRSELAAHVHNIPLAGPPMLSAARWMWNKLVRAA
jgi:hypothetical protein